MFPFSALNTSVEAPEVAPSSLKMNEPHPLDVLTGGAFSAHTASERSARIRDWLDRAPSAEQLQIVFKELSGKDKGAAKLLRERLDEIKRSKTQDSLAQEWADKAQALMALAKLNIADAMAWQRDAAKAGAPLSKEPLASFRGQLNERVKVIEDLQHRVQVQREAAVLLAQRIEVLSTKSWRDAQMVLDALQVDVAHWQEQATALLNDADWPSVEAKFPPLLEASRTQLLVVWEAFKAALTQASAAASDPAVALPSVPVWADELRLARGVPVAVVERPQRPAVDPEIKAKAISTVREALSKLELEIAQGHGKASAGAANALRNTLKEFGKLVDDKLENQAHGALAAASELEGWQRWRADQLREELVLKAEGLLNRPEGQAMGGRKMQENLRLLREQWKQTDQGGVPNHGLWKRFDDACNEGHKVVEVWLDKVKAETAEHRSQRLALIEELNAWASANPVALDGDWKGFSRLLYEFGDRWRDGGYVGEKIFAELQLLWKAAIDKAAAPLEAMQKNSLALRQTMIEEAKALGAEPMLRIDAVKVLQQRWQAEAHAVPMERRHEQKLWDAFRKPIDDAFNRKTEQREKADAALGQRDRIVLDAAKALEAANASGDAQAIRSAMSALEAALRGQAQAKEAVQAAAASHEAAAAESSTLPSAQVVTPPQVPDTPESGEAVAATDSAEFPVEIALTAAVVPAKTAPRPVVAVRGDDRPGMKKTEPTPLGRGGKFGERKEGGRDSAREGSRGPRDARFASRPDDRSERARDDRVGAGAPWQEAPRLGDSAFRAQRDALEHAQFTLRKLASQAHGEALTQLLGAWEQRDAGQVPTVQELGSRVTAASRSAWVKALTQVASGDASVTLLRLEMAAELPTPAEYIDARRALQLQLLTRRNDPTPIQTWTQDVAAVLASGFDAGQARRLQNVLKVLLKP